MLITATAAYVLSFEFAYEDAEESAMEQDEFDGIVESGPSSEDEAYYTDEILSGRHDEREEAYSSWIEDCYDPDEREFFPGDEYSALDAYERSIYGY